MFIPGYEPEGWLKGRLNASGENNPFSGKSHTKESRQKMRDKLKGRIGGNLGKFMSEDQKEKLRQANLGKIQSKETIEKRMRSFENKPKEEKIIWKNKIISKLIGNKWNVGKKDSEETKEKKRLAQIKRRNMERIIDNE